MKAIYVRQSLDKKDSLSIDSQIEDCIKLCKRNGWDEYKVYSDKGWSAKNLDRPNFKRMNRDVESGFIDAVVCYKIDRISRSIRDLVNLIEDYSDMGVHFISFADNINTAAPGGMMMATLFGSLAQMEREAIITRVTDNYYYRCEHGFWGGGPAPYGYDLKKTMINGQKHTILEQNEEEANIVRLFYQWYLEPEGTVYTILKNCIRNGITTRKGGEWTSRVVSDILAKPLYAPNSMDVYNFYEAQGVRVRISPEQCDGEHSINIFGIRDKNSKHPKRSRPVSEMTMAIALHRPIIDSKSFLMVQFKKKSMLAKSPRSGTSKSTFLTGLVKCGFCGRAFSPSGSRKGVRYFSCSSKRNYASTTCQSHGIKVESLEMIIKNDLLEYIKSDHIKVLLSNSKSDLSAKDNSRINSLQQEAAQKDIEINHLLDAITSGNNISMEYLNRRIELLDSDKRRILDEISKIKNDTNVFHMIYNGINIDAIPNVMEHDTMEAKKEVCRLLINRIDFIDPYHITISYKV